jgi:predicted TIM-barrel fold metal-dependent hydrolase
MAETQGWDPIDAAWLAQVQEPALDPDAPIVDPHHHLWQRPSPYETRELLADLQSGHRVVATVYTDAGQNYRAHGPEHLRPVGEVEHLVALAEASDRAGNAPRICAGITGGGDLTAGAAKVEELLDAQIAAGKGRFSGVRANNLFVTFLPGSYEMVPVAGWESAVDDAAFLTGVSCLARRSLALDLVCSHAQLGEPARLAQRFPDLVIVLNHLAPYADFGPTPKPESELLAEWKRAIQALAPHANLHLKLGGLANPMMAHSMPALRELRSRARPPTSEELAELYRPMASHAIETLGPSRCMFESNFPVDKSCVSYVVLWNAFKRLARPYSKDERAALLMGTAVRAYKLKDVPA